MHISLANHHLGTYPNPNPCHRARSSHAVRTLAGKFIATSHLESLPLKTPLQVSRGSTPSIMSNHAVKKTTKKEPLKIH